MKTHTRAYMHSLPHPRSHSDLMALPRKAGPVTEADVAGALTLEALEKYWGNDERWKVRVRVCACVPADQGVDSIELQGEGMGQQETVEGTYMCVRVCACVCVHVC